MKKLSEKLSEEVGERRAAPPEEPHSYKAYHDEDGGPRRDAADRGRRRVEQRRAEERHEIAQRVQHEEARREVRNLLFRIEDRRQVETDHEERRQDLGEIAKKDVQRRQDERRPRKKQDLERERREKDPGPHRSTPRDDEV